MRAQPQHHPADDVLVQHAAGQLDLARRVMVEAHLGFCPACRQASAAWSAPGRRWLDEQTPAAPVPDLLERLEARLDALPGTDRLEVLGHDLPLPTAARAELPLEGPPLRLRRLPLSSARAALLHGDSATDSSLLLVRIAGGKRFPGHRHLGTEDVVVLSGAYGDHTGHFAPGDYQRYPVGTVHAPLVDPGPMCWIVTRIEGGVRFLGLRGLLARLSSG